MWWHRSTVIYLAPPLGRWPANPHLGCMDIDAVPGYLLIAGVVLAVAVCAGYAQHNTRARKIARERAQEDDARVKIIQDQM